MVAIHGFEEVSFDELFARSVGADPDRVGLPGVQEKVSARMITLPVRERGTSHLLKLTPPDLPALVENEAFFLEAARRSGLRVADARVVTDAVGCEPPGEWRVSPAFDLPSSYLYGDMTVALPVAGRAGADITRRAFVELGKQLRLPEQAIGAALDQLCDRVDLWLPDLDSLPFPAGQLRKLRRTIEYRRRLLRGLAA